jgi:hypothetical protein
MSDQPTSTNQHESTAHTIAAITLVAIARTMKS